MDVALLHPYYWPEVRRGSERVVHDLAAGFATEGHAATVLTTHAARRAATRVEDGVTVRRLGRRPERLAAWTGLPAPAAHLPAAWRALRAAAPDVAHALYVGEGLAALAWARRAGRPAVFSAMGLPHAQGAVGRGRALAAARRVAGGVDAVVAISAAVAEGWTACWEPARGSSTRAWTWRPSRRAGSAPRSPRSTAPLRSRTRASRPTCCWAPSRGCAASAAAHGWSSSTPPIRRWPRAWAATPACSSRPPRATMSPCASATAPPG